MGAIFCQVIMINAISHEIPLITSGNQKWKGAAAIFKSKAELTRIEAVLDNPSLRFVLLAKIKIENKSKADAIACTIKYLIVASGAYLFLNLFIRGIKDNKLISKPIHAVNQDIEEIEINVPIIIVFKNNNL